MRREPHLGMVIEGSPIWAWLMVVIDGYGNEVSVAFNREQAEEMRRRLNKALGEAPCPQ